MDQITVYCKSAKNIFVIVGTKHKYLDRLLTDAIR